MEFARIEMLKKGLPSNIIERRLNNEMLMNKQPMQFFLVFASTAVSGCIMSLIISAIMGSKTKKVEVIN